LSIKIFDHFNLRYTTQHFVLLSRAFLRSFAPLNGRYNREQLFGTVRFFRIYKRNWATCQIFDERRME